MPQITIPDNGLWSAISTSINSNFSEIYTSSSNDSAVYIQQESDFPVQGPTTITLESNTVYVLCADITVTKPFIVNDRVAMTGRSPVSNLLTYNGSGVLFTALSSDFTLYQTVIDCPNAQPFSLDDRLKVFVFRDLIILRCAKVGVIGEASVFSMRNVLVYECTDGISITGPDFGSLDLVSVGFLSTTAAITGLNLGTTKFRVFTLEDWSVLSSAGGVGISGPTGSINFNPGDKGIVDNCQFKGVTPLVGVSQGDVRWRFSGCTGILDSFSAGETFINNSGSGPFTIPVTSVGVFVQIDNSGGATWAEDVLSRFSSAGTGVLTYIGEEAAQFSIFASATIEKTGSGANLLEGRLAVNWTPGSSGLRKTQSMTENATPTSISCKGIVTLNPGDNVRMILANLSATNGILVYSSALNVALV